MMSILSTYRFPDLVTYTILLQVLPQAPGELFRIRSTFIYSPKSFEEAIRVKTHTTKFINDRVAFRLQLFPKRRVVLFNNSF